MKLLSTLMAVAFSTLSFISIAQTSQGITDDDLRKYAITQDSIKGMQQTLVQIITENVQKNTVMPVARYNELFKIASDEAKLTAANATEDERAFLKEIADLRQYNIDRINAAYQALAKDYVGLKAFNQIRKTVETDQALKSRYEAIVQEVQNGTSESASTKQDQSQGN